MRTLALACAVVACAATACGGGVATDAAGDAVEVSSDALDGSMDAVDVQRSLDAGNDSNDVSLAPDGDGGTLLVPFTTWRNCGWSDGTADAGDASMSCSLDLQTCDAIAAGVFASLGSTQWRICARSADECEFVMFSETEGGGTGRRCVVPRDPALRGADWMMTDCTVIFECNELMGNCPPSVMPPNVISCAVP